MMTIKVNRTILLGLAGFVLTAAWSSTTRAECEVSEPDETVCDAETAAFTERFVDGSRRGFQPPAVNGSDDVGYIAGNETLFEYGAFVWGSDGTLLDALVSGDTAEGAFAGIRVSTLDEHPMFSMDDVGNVYGIANVLDEFGGPVLGLVRGGPSGYRLFEDPGTFDAGTFITLDSTTEVLVNDLGTLAFRAGIRRDAGATIVGEGLFLGTSAIGVLAQTGDAAADSGETFLGFLSSLNARTLALNDLGGVAFSAIVSGSGVDAGSDERLIAFDGSGFMTLAREGGAAFAETPNLAFGGSAPNAFGWVSHNMAGDTAFLARLTEGVVPSEFITGGSGGATDYDGLFVAPTAGDTRGIAIRGNDASVMFDESRYAGDQFITNVGPGRLNNSGEVAFFANAGINPLGGDSLGLFVYDIESDAYTRIFQTSGNTVEDIFSLGDSVDGLTFWPTTELFFNELAINDVGDLVFTADVAADIGSPTRRGLFFADGTSMQTLALEGAEIDVAGGGLRTISFIEFLGGSTSSGRPSGLADSGAVAFGLVFDDGASGIFTDTFQPIVVQDFLWSGDCGSPIWHDGCGPSNWDNRNTGEDAPRSPGSDPADRAFIVDADVVLAEQPADLFSIDATGSLTVRSAMSLGQASTIDNLTLEGDLSTAGVLTLGGADGVWRSGTISGAGNVSLLGTTTETGRLVVDTDDVVTLDAALIVDSIGDLAIDDGTLNVGGNGSVLVDGLEAGLTLTGGRITQAAANPAQYAVDSTGQLVKAGAATAVVEAGYRQTEGVGLIGGGELIFAGDVLLGMDTEILADGTLTFAADTGSVWQDASFTGEGVLRLEAAALDARGNVSVDLADGGEFILDGAAVVVADAALDLGPTTTVRKTGQTRASVSGVVLRGDGSVDEGVLAVSRSELLGSSVAVASGATLTFEGEPTTIGGEVTITGDGLIQFDQVRISDDPASDEDLLVLDLDNVWNGVTWQGNSEPVLGDPNITQPSLTVRNRQSSGLEPGSTATLQTVTFVNGESPGISLDRDPSPGTFQVPAGANLVLSEQTEFINVVDSSFVVDGDIVVRDGATAADVEIFNRGTMVLRGSLLAEPEPRDGIPRSLLTNNGELLISGGAEISGLLENGSTGTITVPGGEVRIGENFADRFDNQGALVVSDAIVRVRNWNPETLSNDSVEGKSELRRGTWDLENSAVFGPLGAGLAGDIFRISEDAHVRLSGNSFFQGLPRVEDSFLLNGFLELEDITFEVRDGWFLSSGRLRLDNAVIDAPVVVNQGEVEIGASPGIATIDGDFENAGVLEIELAGTEPGTGYDQLIVNGTTTFQPGGLISITLLDPDESDGDAELFTPRTGDAFEIIVTDELVLEGGVDVESILSFTNAPGGLRFDVDLNERGGLFSLMLSAQFGIEQGVLDALSGNALAAGQYLDALLKSGSLDDDPRLDAIGNLAVLGAAEFPTVAAQWHPEIYAAAPVMGAFERVWALTGALERQAWDTAGVTGEASGGIWLSGVGAEADTDGEGDRQTSGFDGEHSGLLFGGDVALGQSGFVGAFVGREQHDQTFEALPGDQQYDGNVYGIYGGVSASWIDLAGYVAYQDGESDGERRIVASSTTQTLGGEFDLDTIAVHVSGVWPALWQRGSYAVRPVTALTFVEADRGAVQESGGSFALDVAADDHQALFTDIGLSLDGTAEGAGLRPRLRAGWRFDVDHERHRAAASLAGLEDDGFVVSGARLPQGMGYVSGSLTWVLDNRVRLFLGYDGTFAQGYSSHGGQLGIRIPL